MRVYIANGHRSAAVFCAPAALQWYRMIDASAKKPRGDDVAPQHDACFLCKKRQNDTE